MKDGKLKDFLKYNVITKPLYRIYQNKKRKKYIERRTEGLEKFTRNSMEVMKEIQEVFPRFSGKIDFFFSFGTLLGIIRDGRLLGRDMDLDMVVLLDNNEEIFKFREYLINNGFDRLHSFEVNGVGINQDAFIFNDVMVDINYAKPAINKYNNYLFYDLPEQRNKVLIFSFTFTKTVKYKFGDIQINIPENPDQYLAETYGDDWKIPNPNYIYWENPKAIKTDLTGDVEVINRFKYC